ncbi:DUF397 domain-containing protein [Nocardiopsis alkaliphila]|uniref:DUF397 domain-containing protein n=1 Tax=Nocardiopsis alkaliphila TaxID=225762 RepID=UPI00034ADA23|nr:DUF397 domain-containing protein [Nocardiopsis alkaliphila]
MRWVKSSASSNPQGCVQVRSTGEGLTEIGDTKDPHGPTLTVPTAVWDHFLDQVASDRNGYGRLSPRFLPEGGFTLTDTAVPGAPVLTYTEAEWVAFRLGAQAGELRGSHPRGVPVG